jgi:hypothetical protein
MQKVSHQFWHISIAQRKVPRYMQESCGIQKKLVYVDLSSKFSIQEHKIVSSLS